MDILRVARRILAQLARDPRFLVLSGVVPVALVLLLKYVFKTLTIPVPLDAYAIPIAGFFIFFITFILCTIVLVRERRDGTLTRMFACGYGRHSVVLGYVTGYSTIAAVQTALVLVTTVYAFGVSLGSNTIAIAATTMSLSVVSLSLGVFISTVARSEGQIFPLIPLITIPSILLSGLILPLHTLPAWLRVFSYSIPLTVAEKVVLGITRDGRSLLDTLPSFLALIGFGVGLLVLASATLREAD